MRTKLWELGLLLIILAVGINMLVDALVPILPWLLGGAALVAGGRYLYLKKTNW